MDTTNRPSAQQLAYLRSLAERTGTSFSYPTTKSDASAEIKRLKAINGRGHTFAEQAAQGDHSDIPTRNGAAIRDFEVTGHGSAASLRATSEEPYDGLGRTEMWG